MGKAIVCNVLDVREKINNNNLVSLSVITEDIETGVRYRFTLTEDNANFNELSCVICNDRLQVVVDGSLGRGQHYKLLT